ncbi:MAG: NAD(P)H-dependent oxidoreductase subunit E [Bacteroidales bacterium]|jgi:NADH-quinone oxidoreductase subunit E/NADP-reducing hydrogenase subunit HndA|nr:NAD(P)H-dependent oxidoreductase subunit E [Bacteroidales bacterium]MBR0123023.1 NAD(P)H-dependent oxidoreductase subunit E [Bacteroidales bacterium]MBR5650599.1 NAD(P)H-dependent oxidoreductase subunit E [Bacteroidales bacterium]MBR5719439.1 NAD(P)H-dependent oxidoreductase subunit E [Bacteroidales bacterium]MBR6490961.1 NAD(P)H-dependent oxidoreductase subunit E [Bacteroidales bacterium]
MANIKITLHEEDVKKLNDVCNSFGNKPGEVINVLHAAQGIFGYLPAEVQEIIAANLHIPVAKVYGIVSFYSFFTMKPKGKHPISVCLGTACYVRGSEKILEELKKQLNIEVGGTTADGKFSLSCLRCVGACGLAPVMIIGDQTYGRVSPGMVKDILAKYQD